VNKRKTTRRDFTKTVATLAVAPLTVAAAESTAAADQPAQTPPPRDPLTVAADALTEIVRARHGRHLTDEQIRRVRQSIQNNLRSAERLRRFPLNNSDEPAFLFSADVP
jgi:hypothetical protein